MPDQDRAALQYVAKAKAGSSLFDHLVGEREQ
jgi:hypothetical protein